MKVNLVLVVSLVSLFTFGCESVTKEKQLEQFIDAHVAKIKPLSKQASLAYWDASTTGNSEAYERVSKLNLKIQQIYNNPEDFAILKEIKESGQVTNNKLARQSDKLYYAYLRNQIEPELLKKLVDADNRIQKKYNTFRGTIDGEKVTMSDIYTILTTEEDCRKRELAWRASKQVGNVIFHDLIEQVKLRNMAAQKAGFDNYHTLSIVTGEQSVEELDAIFDELCELTNEPFTRMKKELDSILADSYGITTEDLRPWHYHDPFFQRTPLVYEIDLDIYYKDHDVRELAQRYYAGIGLPVDDILARSDLYDREGKYPHAFSFEADRDGDVRILCNLQNTERWMETILHELGHAVYSKYHDRKEPWLLREPAHSFTTEAIAMFFGRLSRNANWMQQMLNLSDSERVKIERVSEKYLRFQQVLFVRWALVMYNFEKQLYADPDQDLNTLWWDLVEKYQFVKRPDGPVDAGWASKLHFTTAPCYYHNYMLGEMLASQLHHYIVYKILSLKSDENVSYVGQREVGDFIREKVLEPGAVYHWNEMIKQATGELLAPKYFVEQFVE
ncbi:MAG: M2 family metallopeptidase [Sedimentisphaerales bacterium]|nr:M2 family metallopeptidase [Sedimentisphaerales bacterium]